MIFKVFLILVSIYDNGLKRDYIINENSFKSAKEKFNWNKENVKK